MTMLASMLNNVWRWYGYPESARFARATRRVRATQQRVLRAILTNNAHSAYGRKHAFEKCSSDAEFQRRVPVCSYEQLTEWTDRVAAGESHVLTSEPVLLFEPTSGTTAGAKWIPYTRSLRRQFQRAIAVWITDLLHSYPAVRRGRAYWSVSPAGIRPHHTAGGIPVGFDDDAQYLATWQQGLVRRLLVVPAELARLEDVDAFRYATSALLAAAEDLALISVWSPTFLSTLVQHLEGCWPRIVRDLHDGNWTGPQLATAVWRRDRKRATRLEGIWSSDRGIAEKLALSWPRLALISAWADASAASYAKELCRLFPAVPLQPKGLLATEGVVTIPRAGRSGGALALRSHFFEFEAAAGTATDDPFPQVWRADQLEIGAAYRVIITTGGGLYRYRLGDEVEVVGREAQCPLLRFVGRPQCSDLVGEKLHERQVRAAFESVFAQLELQPSFCTLRARARPQPGYELRIECAELSPPQLANLQRLLNEHLRANPYYAAALDVGQLEPLRVVQLDSPPGAAWQAYEQQCLARGQRAGSIKPPLIEYDV